MKYLKKKNLFYFYSTGRPRLGICGNGVGSIVSVAVYGRICARNFCHFM